MNDLQELRRTLADHADAVHDGGSVDRTRSVRRRATVVRRRRQAGGAVGALAAVAVVAGLSVVHLGGHDAAGPADEIVGVPVPAHLTSLGFRYDYGYGVDGHDGLATVKLKASSTPRLVSWATSGSDDAVRVSGAYNSPVAVDVRDFSDWVYVAPGAGQTLTVRSAHGEPGLAVYALGDPRPAGVTVDGTTFRNTVAGQPLLGAAVGRAGQSSVSARATATGPGITVHYFCSGGPKGAWVHVKIGHEKGDTEGLGCDDDVPVDGTQTSSAGQRERPGNDVSPRVWVTQGENGPLVTAPSLRLGVGVYSTATNPVGPLGYAPPEIETSGHLWRKVSLEWSQAGQRRLSVATPRGGGEALVVAFGGARGGNLGLSSDPGGSSGARIAGLGGAIDQIVGTGARSTARLYGGQRPAARALGLAVYVRAD